jgi:Flp pilus assembly protein TadG
VRAADEGAAAVEFALVLPLLLFVVFGIVDFGLAFQAQIIANNAVREGARTASLGGTYNETIASTRDSLGGIVNAGTPSIAATCTMVKTSLPCASWGPSSPTTIPPADSKVMVTATVNYRWITPVGAVAGLAGGGSGQDLGTGVTIVRSSTMRVE